MLELVRNANAVFYNGRALTVNAQASKGPNNEVVKIAGLPGANGRKWLSLSKLKQGLNQLELEPSNHSSSTQSKQKYKLTADEQARIDELQAQINEIIEAAKARYVEAPADVDPSQLSADERAAAIAQAEKYLAFLKANSK